MQLRYHMPTAGLPINPTRFLLAIGASLPADIPAAHKVTPSVAATTFDATTKTLNAPLALGASTAGATWSASAPVTVFGQQDITQAALATGGLTYEVPLTLPSGPGGLTPQLHLAYSSDAMAANHGPQAAGNWVGEGWNLDLGAISWSEAYINDQCPGTSGCWRSSWSISDPYGSSGALIPPTTTTAPWYDNTGNALSTGAVQWHMAQESHARIYSFPNPNVDNTFFPPLPTGPYTQQPPCWRVWLPSGIMEEFGCTFDSRQFYRGNATSTSITPGAGNTPLIISYKLDLIVDPSGNQIQINYSDDLQGLSGSQYRRDLIINSIQ